MTTLATRIEALETKIAATTNKYKAAELKSQLGFLKAEQKGNFVTKEDLTEFKGLIIWAAKKALYYNTQQNVVEVAKRLLAKVENNEIVFKTRRGIKSLLVDNTFDIATAMNYEIYFTNNPEAATSDAARLRCNTYQAIKDNQISLRA